ncbi:methyltransferase domain-containing protein [Phenylobacterium aquaticum]|uniref:methyltransferase domain-containing protein n=2 Tax=Phenylobacterium aquaticum TaxID=1763816 RepID=UPI0026E9CC80|nr:methyltransferase domain-containing protein [Phenylobacterium aquaticum]
MSRAPQPLTPRIFDRALLRTRLDRAAKAYGQADFLKRRAAEDIVARLEVIMRDFPRAVDIGARNGAFRNALASSDAAPRVGLLVETEIALGMLGGRDGPRLMVDEEQLPFAFASLDLAVSSLALHWTNDVIGTLIQIRRALKPDGLFIGALFGGATLTELRQSLMAAEMELTGGAGPRVSPFADPNDAASLLQRAGFALPVADVDRVTVRYAHPLKLMADLRAMGETSVLAERHPRPLTRAVLARAFEIYAERFAEPDGRIPATFEILTLTGWTPSSVQQQPLKPGSAKMRLADALKTVEHPLPREED